MKKSNKATTSKKFDEQFDSGESVLDYLDVKKAAVRKNLQRINIDFPVEFLRRIDNEATKIGVARTALIKMWLAEKLQHINN